MHLGNKYNTGYNLPSGSLGHSTLHHHSGMGSLLHLHEQYSALLPLSGPRWGSGCVAEPFGAFQGRVETSQPLRNQDGETEAHN